ncbi:hypothetical protein LNV09_10330 [Paucibacter sp. B2R-40]|uniref:hypothetical protein n=1 Tax=Paucibacter sp. B2R-40 TaxID=2893554 RepID=UPI0021E3D944|nr:hypothetical protein [Paucibacter sp. B2R-40]MCV2354559.1 hypothetical protein [Paucibacter sp. B2R-40]
MKHIDIDLRAEAPRTAEAAGGLPPDAEAAASVAPYFDPETVVTLDVNGQPLSLYKYPSWDFRALSADGNTTQSLYFFEAQPLPMPRTVSLPDLAALIREQHKALLWLHIDAGRMRAFKTLESANHALNRLSKTAYCQGVSLFDLMTDPISMTAAVAKMNVGWVKSTKALIKTLWRHQDFLKVNGAVKLKQLQAAIKEASSDDSGNDRQTPILPSRIYCAILGRLLESLDEIEQDLDEVLQAFQAERAGSLDAPDGLSAKQLASHRHKTLAHVDEFLKTKGYDPQSGDKRKPFLEGLLTRTQARLMHTVIAFSGMRVGEALMLPLQGVLEDIEYRNQIHYVIKGYTSKLDNGIKRAAQWVTSHEGQRAIKLAQRIAFTILDIYGGDNPTQGRALLFCSSCNPYKAKDKTQTYAENFIPMDIRPIVMQQDIDELNAMELARPWQRDGLEVGKPWPLTYHQYRRSLAVYAHRSGMVSLPGLKSQLQHITQEMASYYSDGFCRAVNLVFDKEHFSHEWKAAASESSYMAYTLAILFSDEELIDGIGGKGAGRIAQVVANRSKAETLKLFEQGKLKYKETVLGGCVSTEECKQTPLEPIPWDCIEGDCPNAIVFGKRLNRLLETQQAVVATLESNERGSVEHRLETDHLRVLLKARQRLQETQ